MSYQCDYYDVLRSCGVVLYGEVYGDMVYYSTDDNEKYKGV